MTAIADAPPAIADVVFEDVKKLILHVAHQFNTRYGGETDEWIAHANYIYVTTLHKYQKDRGGFSQFVRNQVFYGLLESVRLKARRHDLAAVDSLENPDLLLGQEFSQRFVDLVEGTTPDAQFVIDAILHTPEDLKMLLEARKRVSQRSIQKTLRIWLATKGWPQERSEAAFESIGDAL